MSLANAWRRFRLFVARDRAMAELAEEMRLHRAFRTESLLRQGALPADAPHLARRQFGNPVQLQEASRDIWGFGTMEELTHNLRYALRRLRQRPAFALAVIIVLGLGIGATTAMFSAVDAAMLRPLPFARPQE